MPSETFTVTSSSSPVFTWSDPLAHRCISVDDVRSYTSHIVGRLKTLADMQPDPEQRKAFKDAISWIAWDYAYTTLVQWAGRQTRIDTMNPDERATAETSDGGIALFNPFPFGNKSPIPPSIPE